ncbi:MAG TPA: phosphodiester glycosidase family protein [Bacillota bacterium]|nr:phosphodiester glycosidase family protein [Bacillota bacterium]
MAMVATAAGPTLPSVAADDDPPPLGIGLPDLPETRHTTEVAPGITHTTIERGLPLEDPDEIPTTQTGPWVVNVLTIDPDVADGRMAVTDGPTLADTETVQDLAAYSGALAAINSSFFTFTGDPDYPGDAGGLTIRGGRVVSEPSLTQEREVDLIFDSRTNRMRITSTTWRGTVTMDSGTTLTLDRLNHRPVVPQECTDLADQTECDVPGELVRFHDDFAAETPPGHGVEVVFDDNNCVVAVHQERGTALRPGQTSVQATGSDAAELAALGEGGGCGTAQDRVYDDQGRRIPLTPHTWAVTGRVPLVADGHSVVPDSDDSFFGRHPRTFVGKTADGSWMFVVVDGRALTSVGATLDECARIALDLGMVDAINLDGGGSTTMVIGGELINRPSTDGKQRKVGDALVWLP